MRKKLLFVDDDQNFLAGIARRLRSREEEWELILTTSAPQAFKKIRENKIDVIVSDVFMPGTGGMELLEYLKNGIQAHTIPIIMITGKNDSGLKRRAIELGAADILNKPIETEELEARLISSLVQKAYLDQMTEFNATLVQKVNERTQELMEANRKLEKPRKEAELANQTKSSFLKNISHELRTPLNTIIGFSEVVESNLIKKNEGLESVQDLKRINKAGKHLLKLIDDILYFSKFETGMMALDQENFELSVLVSEMDMVIRPIAEKKKFKLVYEGDLEGRNLYGDKRKLKQILFNLLENATNFTKKGQITLTALRRDLSKDSIGIEISDTGIGMSQDQIDNLFVPIEQGDSSVTKSHGGTGLGLVISRSLAQFMGGDIFAESKAGVGSTFTLTIPMINVDSERNSTEDGNL
jgi:signal transduction histidine kinase